jgi:DNA-binding transcriptional LysR family regulator
MLFLQLIIAIYGIIMDRFQMLNVYVAVAEAQGFAAAARRLNMSPPAVTRCIAALEDHLDVKLLQRTTRYVRTTEAGDRYLEDAKRILAEIDVADATATGINATPAGHIAITAPVLFGRQFVIPAIVEYLNRYPATEVGVTLLDRVVNMLEEGIDVGLRIGKLPDSTMRALPVGSVRMVLCASPEYLKTYGTPTQPEDLINHNIIASTAGNNLMNWRFTNNGKQQDIRLNVRLCVNTNDAAIEAATQGFGITRLLSYQVASQISDGNLKIILNHWEPEPLPVNIVHREDRHGAAKVRAFIDLLAEHLRSDPFLNPAK